MLLKWLQLLYHQVKAVYSIYGMAVVVIIGLFCIFASHKELTDKKLKRDAKIARYIGITYVFGGVGLYIFLQIF